MMGQLYDVETHTINYHLKKVFADSELQEDSVIRNFRITAADGKTYDTQHYKLSAIISAYLDMAEMQAMRNIPMTMEEWEKRLSGFLQLWDREILRDAGKRTAELARAHAESEFEKHRIVQDRLFELDFEAALEWFILRQGYGGQDGELGDAIGHGPQLAHGEI